MRRIFSRTILAVLAIFMVLCRVDISWGGVFSAESQKWAPVPAGHVPGKDNGVDSGQSRGNRFHMPGEDCGICHNTTGKASRFNFSISGTIYKDRTGREPLEGAEIILKDAQGGVISMTSNAAGNFFTYTPIKSDYNGWDSLSQGAFDETNPGNWRYKAWIKYDGFVTSMATIAPVGGMSTARMGCGMHHGPTGSRGALLPGGLRTLPSYPSSDLSYKNHVLPILRNKCKTCHMPGAANPKATYPTGYTFDYSGGLDLTAYEKDALSAKGIADVVDKGSPDASALLAVPIKDSTGHAGGKFWTVDSADYKAIRQWIAEGARNN
ncbi:MAG: carboxypeptidase regulatory-like domain-containing protein [Nitrospinae bacterium]|nr:carboxypeptidase regulatory-like domain-containing protein [Nitrospinota bacterium]